MPGDILGDEIHLLDGDEEKRKKEEEERRRREEEKRKLELEEKLRKEKEEAKRREEEEREAEEKRKAEEEAEKKRKEEKKRKREERKKKEKEEEEARKKKEAEKKKAEEEARKKEETEKKKAEEEARKKEEAEKKKAEEEARKKEEAEKKKAEEDARKKKEAERKNAEEEARKKEEAEKKKAEEEARKKEEAEKKKAEEEARKKEEAEKKKAEEEARKKEEAEKKKAEEEARKKKEAEKKKAEEEARKKEEAEKKKAEEGARKKEEAEKKKAEEEARKKEEAEKKKAEEEASKKKEVEKKKAEEERKKAEEEKMTRLAEELRKKEEELKKREEELKKREKEELEKKREEEEIRRKKEEQDAQDRANREKENQKKKQLEEQKKADEARKKRDEELKKREHELEQREKELKEREREERERRDAEERKKKEGEKRKAQEKERIRREEEENERKKREEEGRKRGEVGNDKKDAKKPTIEVTIEHGASSVGYGNVRILSSGLSEPMQRSAIGCAIEAVNKFGGDHMHLAQHIMMHFEVEYGGAWHCVATEDELGFFAHYDAHIHFCVGKVIILLFQVREKCSHKHHQLANPDPFVMNTSIPSDLKVIKTGMRRDQEQYAIGLAVNAMERFANDRMGMARSLLLGFEHVYGAPFHCAASRSRSLGFYVRYDPHNHVYFRVAGVTVLLYRQQSRSGEISSPFPGLSEPIGERTTQSVEYPGDARVITCGMSKEARDFAIATAQTGIEQKFENEKMHMARYIRTAFEKRYGQSFHCVVSDGHLGFYGHYDPEKYIYYAAKHLNIFLFRHLDTSAPAVRTEQYVAPARALEGARIAASGMTPTMTECAVQLAKDGISKYPDEKMHIAQHIVTGFEEWFGVPYHCLLSDGQLGFSASYDAHNYAYFAVGPISVFLFRNS